MRTVNYRDVGALVSRIPKERHTAAVRAIRSTMRTRARVIVREEINATRPRPPMYRGSYTASWKSENVEDGGKVFSTSPYASVIDKGRRPGTLPNIQALIGWVKRHGMQRWNNNPGMRSRVTGKDAQLANARSIAFAIAMAIKKRGIPAKHVFERACKRIVDECKMAVRLAISGAEGGK